MNRKDLLAASVAAALGGAASPAGAHGYTATLQQVLSYSNGGTAGVALDVSSSTATWSYQSCRGNLTQTGGVYSSRAVTSPTTTLYRISVTGLVLGNRAPAKASTFTCTEGNFGGGVGASICGNYSFGANFVNDSTTSWGPGTAVTRTLGGDDFALGPPIGISQFDGFVAMRFTENAGREVLTNRSCTGTCATLPAGAFNNGQQWTVNLTPVPGAVDDEITVGTGVPTAIEVRCNDYGGYLAPTNMSVVVPPDQGGTVYGQSYPPFNWEAFYVYQSAPGFTGLETFTYRISSPYDDTAVVKVTVVDAISNPDGDQDGVADLVDNCTLVANPNQCDADLDGFGNRCDGDLNFSGTVNSQDATLLRQQLGLPSVAPLFNGADLNCNGAVNAQDATLLRQLFGLPPGPSSQVP